MSSDQADLQALLEPLAKSPVECDGMTRLVATVLAENGIAYQGFCGRISVGNRTMTPHFWIEVGPWRIDYRSKMWFPGENGIQEGVFLANQGEITCGNGTDTRYDGIAVDIAPLPRFLFDVLQVPIVPQNP
jgi:hypothetical protein